MLKIMVNLIQLEELFTKIIEEKQMSEIEKDELIDAQKQVIGILF